MNNSQNHPFVAASMPAHSLPLYLVAEHQLEQCLMRLSMPHRLYVQNFGFKATAASFLVLPAADGSIAAALVGLGQYQASEPPESLEAWREDESHTLHWTLGALPLQLPSGDWHIAHLTDSPTVAYTRQEMTQLALGWGLGAYGYKKYKTEAAATPAATVEAKPVRLVWPSDCDRELVERQVEAITLARDLINCPANDLGTEELAATVRQLAESYGAEFTEICGDDLLTENYPLIHAVGRASENSPRLLDLRWGDPSTIKITLVGKGVTFDTGGLDIKPSSGMILMKKDMGGAAVTIALAKMIMAMGLKVRLRLLIPAVENMISDEAMRPSDIVTARSGRTVEIGNTDAEGRLILADALCEAVRESPQLLIDCATLTGAARVALGTELPAVFSRHPALVAALQAAALATNDPLWQLPLWSGYRKQIKGKLGDLNSTGESSYNGAITAANFLAEFVPTHVPWLHLDMMAYNLRSRPGRPEGGEAQAVRALYALVESQSQRLNEENSSSMK